MLTILVLLILGLPPIEIKAASELDRKKYLESMYAADKGDYSKLETLIGNALNESLIQVSKSSLLRSPTVRSWDEVIPISFCG